MSARRTTAALAAALWFAVAATAQTPAADRSAQLDALFVELQAAPSQGAARQVEHRIWIIWYDSDDDGIDALMTEAARATRAEDFAAAEALLSQAIDAAPGFAEAWNRRATVRWMAGDLDGSLDDIAETLAREPRHFGALSGRAAIRLGRGDKPGAREALRAAVGLYPHFQGAWMLAQLDAESR